MKFVSLTSLYFFTNIVTLFAQNQEQKISGLFKNADSIIILSHLTTYVPIIDKVTEKNLGVRKLVINKKPDYSIIKESVKLDKESVDSLIKILLSPNRDTIIENYRCFIPHHGILIFKRGRASFFDICFWCRHFETSKNINLSDELSENSWNELITFFKNRGISYEIEMPKESSEENN